jgi:streptomycin 6-kinase
VVVAGLYERLHVPALPQLRRLSSYVDRWTRRLDALPSGAPVPRRLVEQAVSLGRSFVADEATDSRMIHGDLHYDNVLAGDREPWLVIDPKPVAGDPHYELAPMLWNRWDEVVASGDVRGAVRRRFHTLVDVAGLDEDRARDWVVVRELHNVLWAIEDAERAGRRLTAEDRSWVTTAVAVAKAVQD